MKKYTHVRALNDVMIDGILIFEKGKLYKITDMDFHSLIFYVCPGDSSLPDEFAVTALNENFQFLVMDK